MDWTFPVWFNIFADRFNLTPICSLLPYDKFWRVRVDRQPAYLQFRHPKNIAFSRVGRQILIHQFRLLGVNRCRWWSSPSLNSIKLCMDIRRISHRMIALWNQVGRFSVREKNQNNWATVGFKWWRRRWWRRRWWRRWWRRRWWRRWWRRRWWRQWWRRRRRWWRAMMILTS